MKKYNELIQALRCCATPDYCCPYCPLKSEKECSDKLIRQAEEAIEELSRELAKLKLLTCGCCEQPKEET